MIQRECEKVPLLLPAGESETSHSDSFSILHSVRKEESEFRKRKNKVAGAIFVSLESLSIERYTLIWLVEYSLRRFRNASRPELEQCSQWRCITMNNGDEHMTNCLSNSHERDVFICSPPVM